MSLKGGVGTTAGPWPAETPHLTHAPTEKNAYLIGPAKFNVLKSSIANFFLLLLPNFATQRNTTPATAQHPARDGADVDRRTTAVIFRSPVAEKLHHTNCSYHKTEPVTKNTSFSAQTVGRICRESIFDNFPFLFFFIFRSTLHDHFVTLMVRSSSHHPVILVSSSCVSHYDESNLRLIPSRWLTFAGAAIPVGQLIVFLTYSEYGDTRMRDFV